MCFFPQHYFLLQFRRLFSYLYICFQSSLLDAARLFANLDRLITSWFYLLVISHFVLGNRLAHFDLLFEIDFLKHAVILIMKKYKTNNQKRYLKQLFSTPNSIITPFTNLLKTVINLKNLCYSKFESRTRIVNSLA